MNGRVVGTKKGAKPDHAKKYFIYQCLLAHTMVQTSDETEAQVRYDRQIRLWGHEAQQRMRDSKIVVVSLGGLAVEIVKNLVLAGIGNLTILDNQVWCPCFKMQSLLLNIHPLARKADAFTLHLVCTLG